ncbi:MAG TPA: hypothetical protein PL070_07620 [Flavobacteriales bacterium]|nr:hypothetical protein [Flavobacteriales bacterium]
MIPIHSRYALVVCATLGALTSQSQAPTAATVVPGGWELRGGAKSMQFHVHHIFGLDVEASYRWPGPTGAKDGHFSIGLQLSLWPQVGRWSEVPFSIGTITDSRLGQFNGEDPVFRLNNVVMAENEVFLLADFPNTFAIEGSFNPNPISSTLFVFQTHRIKDLRMKMAGIQLPMRWYFGDQKQSRPRLFLEGAVGMDILLCKAEYEVTTATLWWDSNNSRLAVDETLAHKEEPFDGRMSNNLYFVNGNAGLGVAWKRFELVVYSRSYFTSIYTREGTDHRRVRGNLLAMPLLAGVDQDAEVQAALDGGGVISYARMGLSGKDEDDGLSNGDDGASAVARYWDGQHWLVRLAYRFR